MKVFLFLLSMGSFVIFIFAGKIYIGKKRIFKATSEYLGMPKYSASLFISLAFWRLLAIISFFASLTFVSLAFIKR